MTIKNTLFAVALGTAALGSVAAQSPFQPSGAPDGNTLVRATVHAEHPSLGPEAPTWLAMQFSIRSGWHTYWKNPGDTGAEKRVAYRGPDWASFGPLHWPTPERYTSPGDLLDFVYKGSPVLLAQLAIDPEAWSEAGKPETLRFDLDFEWFVCKDVCLLGEQTLTIEIPVEQHLNSERGVASNRASLFSEARKQLPVAHADTPEGSYKAEFENGRLRIHVPGAQRLTFFPAGSKELALPVDSLREGQKQGETLDIRYRTEAADVDHLEGVLVIERAHPESGQVTQKSFELKVPVKPGKG